MKTNQCLRLPPLGLCTLLLGVSLQLPSPTHAVELSLSSACSSNQIMLRWTGAASVKLQQATSLVNPVWQDMPGTIGHNSCAIPMTNAVAFFRLYDVLTLHTTAS